MKALRFGVSMRASDSWKLPYTGLPFLGPHILSIFDRLILYRLLFLTPYVP